MCLCVDLAESKYLCACVSVCVCMQTLKALPMVQSNVWFSILYKEQIEATASVSKHSLEFFSQRVWSFFPHVSVCVYWSNIYTVRLKKYTFTYLWINKMYLISPLRLFRFQIQMLHSDCVSSATRRPWLSGWLNSTCTHVKKQVAIFFFNRTCKVIHQDKVKKWD